MDFFYFYHMDSESEINKAYISCKKFTKKHYENFPVASLLFPKEKRKYVYSIYCFARNADDIADSEILNPEQKLKLLDEYEYFFLESQKKNFTSIPVHYKNVFCSLYDTTKTFDIDESEFLNLLKAFKQDAIKNRYNSFEELIEYSKLSANPIGHLVLLISGFDYMRNKEFFDLSGKICTALQLTNFWQDVSLDLKINRIYIPSDLMNQFFVTEKQLIQGIQDDNLKELMAFLIQRTKHLFEDGKPLLNMLKGRLKYELKATFSGGMYILNKIEKEKYQVLSERVKLNFLDKIRIFAKSLI